MAAKLKIVISDDLKVKLRQEYKNLKPVAEKTYSLQAYVEAEFDQIQDVINKGYDLNVVVDMLVRHKVVEGEDKDKILRVLKNCFWKVKKERMGPVKPKKGDSSAKSEPDSKEADKQVALAGSEPGVGAGEGTEGQGQAGPGARQDALPPTPNGKPGKGSFPTPKPDTPNI